MIIGAFGALVSDRSVFAEGRDEIVESVAAEQLEAGEAIVSGGECHDGGRGRCFLLLVAFCHC